MKKPMDKTTIGFNPTEVELDVERKTVVRLFSKDLKWIKVRAKFLGRAKPRVVFDPIDEEDTSETHLSTPSFGGGRGA